jgi:hypothetical protein
MKPLKLLFVTLLFTVLAMQQIAADTCCATITFDAETGEPINAQSEKYYEYMNHYCGGDCPTTGPGGWGGPKE